MAKRIRETPEGQKAESIQANYRYALDQIRADTRLTPQGKKQQIAAEFLRASREVTAIKEAVSAKNEQRLGSLRRDLFGTTGGDAQTAISYRDAQERVGALQIGEQDKAVKLLDQAELSGDEVMVKAVVQRSLELAWDQVANSYIEKHPYYGAKLEELWELQEPDGILSGPDGMDNGFLLHVSKPNELGNLYSDGQIEAVANGG
jgi:hypothetical protein